MPPADLCHYNGEVSMSSFNSLKQKLTIVEEKVLVDFVFGCADHGLPITHAQLAGYPNQLFEKHIGPDYVPVGQNWTDCFIERNHETMQTHWSHTLYSQPACALNPEVVKHWFLLVEQYIVKPGIKLHNVYGMDESGFPPSKPGWQKVIGQRGTKTQHKHGGADQENVTAIVTICADGTVLNPTVILKGKNIMAKWSDNNVASAS